MIFSSNILGKDTCCAAVAGGVFGNDEIIRHFNRIGIPDAREQMEGRLTMTTFFV